MKKGMIILVILVIFFIAFVFLIQERNDRVSVPPFPEGAGEGLGYAIAENGGLTDFVETVNGSTIVHLDQGWNMISFTLNPIEQAATDREIVLNPGWNLIGYSSEHTPSLSQSDVMIDGNSVSEAVEDGLIQNQFAYYESGEDIYKLVPSQSSNLYSNRGYWVYSNSEEPLTLTFTGVGGSLIDASLSIDDVTFVNAVGDEFTYSEAEGSLGLKFRRWDTTRNGFEIMGTSDNINSWVGYFVSVGEEGVSIKIN